MGDHHLRAKLKNSSHIHGVLQELSADHTVGPSSTSRWAITMFSRSRRLIIAYDRMGGDQLREQHTHMVVLKRVWKEDRRIT